MDIRDALPSYSVDGLIFFGTHQVEHDFYDLGVCTPIEKEYSHKLVNIMLKAYLARALGFDVYEDDAHWAHFMKIKARIVGKTATQIIWVSHNDAAKVRGAQFGFTTCKNIKKVEELV